MQEYEATPPAPGAWISGDVVALETGYSVGELLELSTRGQFPKAIRISRTKTAFVRADYDAWRERIAKEQAAQSEVAK